MRAGVVFLNYFGVYVTLFDQKVNIVPVCASFGCRGLFQVNYGDLNDPARLNLGVPGGGGPRGGRYNPVIT